jgi:DNA-binding transcriptional regulator YiaG
MKSEVGMLRIVVLLSLCAAPLAAQQNPFKADSRIKSALIAYTVSGATTGTEEYARDGDRIAVRTTSSMKMLGKTVESDQLTLTTPDSMYTVNLVEKQGMAMPNFGPLMAEEYDGLPGDRKKQLHENMKLAAEVFGRALGMGDLSTVQKAEGKETVAGHECEVRRMGEWTFCALAAAPEINLKTSGSLMCMEVNQVATSVSLDGAVPGDRFAVPSGIAWTPPDSAIQDGEATARAMVQMFASDEFRDSLLAQQKEMDEKQAEMKSEGEEMTPEEREQACEDFRKAMNIDLQAAFADAMQQAATDAATSAAQNAAAGAVEGVKKKLKIRF